MDDLDWSAVTRLRNIVVLAALAAVLALPGTAAAKEKLTASPTTVSFGETLVLRGTGWPVIEFCRRQVTLSLKSSQNSFRIGTVRTRPNGRFSFRWLPRRARVGAGSWLAVARMRCESGNDGSPVIRRATARIHIAN